MFSPRAWGWSGVIETATGCPPVLPTCVGMVREMSDALMILNRSPHVRGDGPKFATGDGRAEKFSPRAWGWSDLKRRDPAAYEVLPTCVGMVRRGAR